MPADPHTLARAAATTRGDERTAARLAMQATVRVDGGYRLPDGTTTHLWRVASRAWLAAASGRAPGKAGRPRKDPTRVTLHLSAAARAVLDAAPEGASALVERLVLTAAATAPDRR